MIKKLRLDTILSKPAFLVSSTDFSLGWFVKTNQFFILEGLLESFFIQGQEMSEVDFNNTFQALLVEHPSLKIFLETLSVANTIPNNFPPQKNNYNTISKDTFTASTLKLSNEVLNAVYHNKQLQTLFQAPYKHLVSQNNVIHQEILIATAAESLDLFFNQKHIYNCKKSDYFVLQAQFSNKITEVYHQIKAPNWLSSFHACAVHKNNKTFLLLGDSGAGKSTLSSLLSLSGYRFIADDLVLMDHDLKIYDNPAAVSVKENAWPVIDQHHNDFSNIKESDKTKGATRIKYLPLHKIQNNRPTKFKVDALVWVHYNKNHNADFFTLEQKEMLSRLIPDTWVNPKKATAQAFADWALAIKSYQLNYSDFKTAKALLDAQL